MLEDFLGRQVVIDFRSSYVCLGTLYRIDEVYLELRHADLHDLRDTDVTRENYIVSSRDTGIKRNRKKVLLVRAEVIAVSLLSDVVNE
jgi:hypothetical protein